MSVSGLVRLGGLSAVVGGILLVASNLWVLLAEEFGGQPYGEGHPTTYFVIPDWLLLLASVLILFGLVGLHLRQSEAAGMLGLAGFLVAFLGTALVVGAAWTQVFVFPSLAVEAPDFLDAEQVAGPVDAGFSLSFAVAAVGWALFGVGALVARSYPRWVAVVLVAAALVSLLPFAGIGTDLAFGVAVALVGSASLDGGVMESGRPRRVS